MNPRHDYDVARRTARREAGICRNCPAARQPSSVLCVACASKNRRVERTVINLCRDCAEPREPGSIFCLAHLLNNRAQVRAWREARKADV